MQLETLDKYPLRVLRVLLALKKLEERHQYATYDGLRFVLGPDVTRQAVYLAVLEARRLGVVEPVKSTRGGTGKKSTFRLTDAGREALR